MILTNFKGHYLKRLSS